MDQIVTFVEKNPVTSALVGVGVIALLALVRYVLRIRHLQTATPDFTGIPPITDARLVRDRFSTEKVKEMDRIDVILVGAGPGSLGCAALLARTGRRVLVLEQHDRAGGGSHAFSELGWEWDVGVHYIGDRVWERSSATRAAFDTVSCGAIQWNHLTQGAYDVAVLAGAGDGVTPEHAGGVGAGAFVSAPGDFVVPMMPGKERLVADLKASTPSRLHGVIDKWMALVFRALKPAKFYFIARALPRWLYHLIGHWFESGLLTSEGMMTVTDSLDAVGLGPVDGETVEEKKERERLRWLLTYHAGDYGSVVSRTNAMMMAAGVQKHYLFGAGYPEGGAEMLARGACRTIRACGGRVLVNAPVRQLRIARRSGRMTCNGVELEDGTVISAPIVVSGAGALATYNKLLDPSIVSSVPSIKEAMEAFDAESPDPGPSVCHLQLFLGLREGKEGEELPQANYWMYFANPDHAADSIAAHGGKWVEDESTPYCTRDERSVPAEAHGLPFPIWGCFVAFPSAKTSNKRKPSAILLAEAPWAEFAKWQDTKYKHRPAEYVALKARIERGLLAVFKSRFPGLAHRVEYTSLGTPLSTKHYLSSPHGASYGLRHSPRRFKLGKYLTAQTDISGLYLTGQDILTVGISGGLTSGFLTAAAIAPFEVVPAFGDSVGLWKNRWEEIESFDKEKGKEKKVV